MKKIQDLFVKYQTRFKPPQKTVEEALCDVVKTVSKITLKPNEVVYSVSTKTLHLKTKSLVRQEIFFKKHEILHLLKSRLGEHAPKDLI